MAKRCSFGIMGKKKLSDITNLQSIPRNDEISVPISPTSKECIDKLTKENARSLKLIEERNKLIELSGVEIQNLRIFSQKLQLQNWNLAQSNSHILAEVNAGKEKLKALQHKIACKNAVIKANKLALEGKENIHLEKDREKNETVKSLPKLNNDNKPGNSNTRRAARSQSMGDCSTIQQATEEKANIKKHCLRRQSARFKSEQVEPPEKLLEIEDTKLPTIKSLDIPMTMETQSLDSCSTVQQAAEKEMAKNKRHCVRRHSAKFKSEYSEPMEKLIEIEDTKLPDSKSLDIPTPVETQTSVDPTIKNEQKDVKLKTPELHSSRRSSVGRPSRRASAKVQSYKEVPLNVKMRREE